MSDSGDQLPELADVSGESRFGDRIVIYEEAPGDARVELWLSNGGVWLSQRQMAVLFERDRSVIAKHLNLAYRDGELDPQSTRVRVAQPRKEGGRAVTRDVFHYNLDAIIAVGFRIRSRRGAHFRSWATKLLAEHLVQGYTLNPERILEVGTTEAEQALARLDYAIQRKRELPIPG